jgi:hypothetical protein
LLAQPSTCFFNRIAIGNTINSDQGVFHHLSLKELDSATILSL